MTRHLQTAATLVIVGLMLTAGCDTSPVRSSGGGDDFLSTGRTASFFEAIQIDPRAEDSAGVQFADYGDFNDDGLIDIATAWNQSQPIQIHIQQRDELGRIQFATQPLGGTTPIARVSGLRVADLDRDGFDDVAVLVKETGRLPRCDQSRPDCDVTENGGIINGATEGMIVLLFNPAGVLEEPWETVPLAQSVLAGTEVPGGLPEEGGYADFDLGDIDGVNGLDIVVTLNSPEGDPALDEAINSVDLYPNPGSGAVRDPEGWSRHKLYGDLPDVGAVRISDLDDDGDNDLVVTYPNARSLNIRWLPNPLSFGAEANVLDPWPFVAPVGHVATGANVLELADIDGDGNEDVVVRSTVGKLIQWFKRPTSPSQTFARSPWQVFTIAEFADRTPGAIALGDVTGDGLVDAAIAAEGAVAWFTRFTSDALSQFDTWAETVIIDDNPDPGAAVNTAAANTGTATGGGAVLDSSQAGTDRANSVASVSTDPNATAGSVAGTLVNDLLVVDIDGDGLNDIVGTLDRSGLSGLTNDALVLFRNTLGDAR